MRLWGKRRYRSTNEQLGKGVVAVTRVTDGKTLARKTILILNKEHKKRAGEEFERLKTVNHPHIVRYYDFASEVTKLGQTLVYFFMESCQYGNLYDYIRMESGRIAASRTKLSDVVTEAPASIVPDPTRMNRSQIEGRRQLSPTIGGAGQDERILWGWIRQLASALVYCHCGVIHLEDRDIDFPTAAKQILHRDLKPDNIFLSVVDGGTDVIVKLGDFGHSVELDQSNPAYVSHRNGDYVAPEIREGNEQIPWTEKCDIYSFGCTLYFMCSGGDPDWLCDRTREFIITSLPREYSLNLRGLVADCCQRQPDLRPNACQLYNRAWKAC